MTEEMITKKEHDESIRKAFADGYATAIKTVLQQQEIILGSFKQSMSDIVSSSKNSEDEC